MMTGNLSFQIEHHLFPDLPSNRYKEIAPQVKDVFDRYGLEYTTGSLVRQVASAWHKVIRLSLPNNFLGTNTTPAPLPERGRAVAGRLTRLGADPSDMRMVRRSGLVRARSDPRASLKQVPNVSEYPVLGPVPGPCSPRAGWGAWRSTRPGSRSWWRSRWTAYRPSSPS